MMPSARPLLPLLCLIAAPALAAPTAAPDQRSGTLSVLAPEGGTAFLGKRELGIVPVRDVAVPVGDHRMRVELAGKTYYALAKIRADQGFTVRIDTRPLPEFAKAPEQPRDGWRCDPSPFTDRASEYYSRGDGKRAVQLLVRDLHRKGLCAEDYASTVAMWAYLDADHDELARCRAKFSVVRSLYPDYRVPEGATAAVKACFARATSEPIVVDRVRLEEDDGVLYLRGDVKDYLQIARRIEVRIDWHADHPPLVVHGDVFDPRFSVPMPGSLKGATLRYRLTTLDGAYVGPAMRL